MSRVKKNRTWISLRNNILAVIFVHFEKLIDWASTWMIRFFIEEKIGRVGYPFG